MSDDFRELDELAESAVDTAWNGCAVVLAIVIPTITIGAVALVIVAVLG